MTAPTDIALSNTVVREDQRSGWTVGSLSAVDPDGGEISYALVSGQGDNGRFRLYVGEDGETYIRIASPLDHEDKDGQRELVIEATDSDGESTIKTITIEVENVDVKFSAAPTGKRYASISEATEEGTRVGRIMSFDNDFDVADVRLVDDAGGRFSIEAVSGEPVNETWGLDTIYYVVANGAFDHETEDLVEITVEAENSAGETARESYQIHVLDAPESGDEARGRIVIDASTEAMAEKGGVEWESYLQTVFEELTATLPAFLPVGTGWSPDSPSDAYLYAAADSPVVLLEGEELIYWWADPVTGEDLHAVGGEVKALSFGSGYDTDGTDYWLTGQELSITGLDLSNGGDLMARIFGEANAAAISFMYGAQGDWPAVIEILESLLDAYAQDFVGSAAGDVYSGTLFDDAIRGGRGDDALRGGAGEDLIHGDGGADLIRGHQGDDEIHGGRGRDDLGGGRGDDLLDGGRLLDRLRGGHGEDQLIGGHGADRLSGGSGADVFIYRSVEESTVERYDRIRDFSVREGDRIDLSAVDADLGAEGVQGFSFIGEIAADGGFAAAGELGVLHEDGSAWLLGDVDGDGFAEFQIALRGDPALTEAQLIL